MKWISIRFSFYAAWTLVILMVAVASIALILLTFEAKVGYAYDRIKPKRTPKGKHRRQRLGYSKRLDSSC